MRDDGFPVATLLDAAVGSPPYDSAEAGLTLVEGIAATLHGLPIETLGVPEELDLVVQLDDEARDIIDRFLSPGARKPSERLVVAARDLFGVLLDAYWRFRSLPGSGSNAVLAHELDLRLMRAAADRVRWERHAGGPGHEHLWKWAGAVFDEAITSAQIAGKELTRVPRFTSSATDGSVMREYLRAIAYFAAGFEQMPPEVFGLAGRLIDLVLPSIELDGAGDAPAYLLPRDHSTPPRRAAPPAAGNGDEGRPLSLKRARDALLSLQHRVSSGETPESLAGCSADELLPAIHHLLRQWSGSPPVRRYRRHLLAGKLFAVRGIHHLRRLFAGEPVPPLSGWTFHDASRGGIGVLVPAPPAPMRFGELVGIKPEDGDGWQLAVVRRVWRETADHSFVGLQTLSRRPALASVDDGVGRMEVLLCDPISRGEAVRVAAPPGMLRPGVALFVTSHGSVQKLKPLEAGMASEGFELRVYQAL